MPNNAISKNALRAGSSPKQRNRNNAITTSLSDSTDATRISDSTDAVDANHQSAIPCNTQGTQHKRSNGRCKRQSAISDFLQYSRTLQAQRNAITTSFADSATMTRPTVGLAIACYPTSAVYEPTSITAIFLPYAPSAYSFHLLAVVKHPAYTDELIESTQVQ